MNTGLGNSNPVVVSGLFLPCYYTGFQGNGFIDTFVSITGIS